VSREGLSEPGKGERRGKGGNDDERRNEDDEDVLGILGEVLDKPEGGDTDEEGE
jgi:hypothetical protein